MVFLDASKIMAITTVIKLSAQVNALLNIKICLYNVYFHGISNEIRYFFTKCC